jgi:hypothetical protein
MEHAYPKYCRLTIALWCRVLRRFGTGLKFVGHPGQIHRRLGFHFVHKVTTVDLNGKLAEF